MVCFVMIMFFSLLQSPNIEREWTLFLPVCTTRPDKRVFLVPCKTWLVQLTILYRSTLDKSLFTRYNKHTAMFNWSPCTFGKRRLVRFTAETVEDGPQYPAPIVIHTGYFNQTVKKSWNILSVSNILGSQLIDNCYVSIQTIFFCSNISWFWMKKEWILWTGCR